MNRAVQTTDRNIPVNVTGITTAVAISAGNVHTCALISGQTVNKRPQ